MVGHFREMPRPKKGAKKPMTLWLSVLAVGFLVGGKEIYGTEG
jgi:hypothetical protein